MVTGSGTGAVATNIMAGNNIIGAPMVGAVAVAALKESAPVKSDRRSNKPIMEKRRRARINNCLNELKTLILDATKKDPARHSKLEKADILEKTVKYLQELQRQQAVMQQAADPKIVNKFKAGFTDCANEVSRFPGLEPAVKRRLLQHLSNCINAVKTELHHQQRQAAASASASAVAAAAAVAQAQQLHVQMLPSPPSSPEQDQHHLQQQQQIAAAAAAAAAGSSPFAMGAQIQHTVNGYFLPNGLQVIPTKLPNGSIALVLPQSLPQHQQQQLQQLQQLQQQQQQQQQASGQAASMSIPSRTASTASASSSHSSSGYERALLSPACSMHYAPPSPANSYEAMDCKPSVIQHASAQHQPHHHHQQQQLHLQPEQQQQQMNPQPLSLVMKKQIKEEEQPWRPW